ncbi:MAG: hypothetical protein E7299_10130 [Lachnospiraceae bacterium]|nr:hypothetical protein [Lachnospiraceae bacterium]
MITSFLVMFSLILLVWVVVFPILLLGNKGVCLSMIGIGILALPYIHILSVLTNISMAFAIGILLFGAAIVFVKTIGKQLHTMNYQGII